MEANIKPNDDRLMTKKQVAERLGVSLRSIDRLVCLGRLTKIKILGANRFRLMEVLAIIQGGAA